MHLSKSQPSAAFSCLPIPFAPTMPLRAFTTPLLRPNYHSPYRLCKHMAPHNMTFNASTDATTPTSTSTPPSTDVSSNVDVPTCRVFDFRDTCIPYRTAWEFQHQLVDELKSDASASDALIILEHKPTYTLGTKSDIENILFNTSNIEIETRTSTENSNVSDRIKIIRTERGGEVTYHGPGQIILYPILNLNRHKLDLHWYLRNLEQLVISMLINDYQLNKVGRKDGLTGVWVDHKKICAIGLKVSKWITMHGLAFNVHMDLSPFQNIIPCGIHEYDVTSLHKISSDAHSNLIHHARDNLLKSFNETFGPYQFETGDINQYNTSINVTPNQIQKGTNSSALDASYL